MDIAVLGATGTLGRLLSSRLEAAGHTVRRGSRREGVDAVTGVGLDDLLRGVDVVIDSMNTTALSARRARRDFDRIATNVARSALRHDVDRIVCVAIAGAADPSVNRLMGYYQGKAVQERAYRAASVPSTIVHSTQWFELVDQLVWRASLGPLAVLPTMRMALVAASSVADLVVSEAVDPEPPSLRLLADQGPADPRPMTDRGNREIAIRGPEILTGAQAARRIRDGYGSVGGSTSSLIAELPYFGLAVAWNGLIPADALVDDVTLEDWIASRREAAPLQP